MVAENVIDCESEAGNTARVPVSESAAELLAAECRQPVQVHLVADGAPVRATAVCQLEDSDGNGVGDTVVARFRGAMTLGESEAPNMNRAFQRRVAFEAAHRIAHGPDWRQRRVILGADDLGPAA